MIYRVHFDAPECSRGFQWFGNRRDAERALKVSWKEEYHDEGGHEPWEEIKEADLEAVRVPSSKKALLKLLNRVGTHPDNG